MKGMDDNGYNYMPRIDYYEDEKVTMLYGLCPTCNDN